MFANPWHCRAVDICQFVFGLCPLGVYPWGDRSGALQALHPHHFPFFPLCRGPVLFRRAVCCRRLLPLGFCWFHQRSVLSRQQASRRPPDRCSPLCSLHTSREATVCFNSFISLITDLNMTAKFCASERLGEPSPRSLVSFSAMLFCGLQLRWSAGTGFAKLPTTLVWYSVFYGPIGFPTALRNRANLLKELRSSSSRCKNVCRMSRACAVLSHGIS